MTFYQPKTSFPYENVFDASCFQPYSSVSDILRKLSSKRGEKRENQNLNVFKRFFWRSKPPDPPPPPPKNDTFLEEGIVFTREAIASTAASIVSVSFTQPLDILKQQYFQLPRAQHKGQFFVGEQNLYYLVRNLYELHGIEGFYRGYMTMQRRMLFHTISMFYTQQRVYEKLQKAGHGHYPNLCYFISGFLSTTFVVIALKPIVAYRNHQKRIRTIEHNYGSIVVAYNKRRSLSLMDLYKGTFPVFMHLGVQYGLRFLLYNKMRDLLLADTERKPLDPNGDLNHYRLESTKKLETIECLFAGAVAGVVGDLLSHPLEVVAFYLQMNTLERQQFSFTDTCRRYHQCIWLILRRTHFKGFFVGLKPSLIKSMVSVAVQFAVFEKMNSWLYSIYR